MAVLIAGDLELDRELPGTGLAVRVAWLIAALGSVLCAVVGVRLVRGNRRLVLFLRRFGHSQATAALTYAATTIGRSWRLVTLDDAQIAPIGAGVPPGSAIARLQSVLDGRDVLAYTTDPKGLRQFAHALYAQLETDPPGPGRFDLGGAG